jgi:VWFA-related protein
MPLTAWTRLPVLLCALAPAAPAAAQAPTFGASAEAITVDVVVLDANGHPVTDLQRGDFTLIEDGRAQPIVGFETRVPSQDTGAAGAVPGDGPASNEHPPSRGGRTLAFLVDDAGIEPLHLAKVTASIARWLAADGETRDVITIVTSSGDAWWSDTVGGGRDDLQAVLARLKGRKPPSTSAEFIGDWEAASIAGHGAALGRGPSGTYLERVVDRWLRHGACPLNPMDPASSRSLCASEVGQRAREVYDAARARAASLLSAVERLSTGLSGVPGRKSVIVLSEGLLPDTDRHAFERAVDASRRGNTAVSFVDVRGLIGMPVLDAGQRGTPAVAELSGVSLETTLDETAGGQALADATGGTMVRNTNDVAGRVAQLADESAAWYLLGYQSDRPHDGKWRALTVTVSRPGLTVRARPGYFATAIRPELTATGDQGRGDKKRPAKGLPSRPVDAALVAGGDRDQLPLRAAAHVLEMDAGGGARVLVALEVGRDALTFAGTGGARSAQLDLTVLGVSRDHEAMVPVDTHVALKADEPAPDGWYVFTRELRLPPGPAQVRALVRDAATGRAGLVTQRLTVPSPERPYMSTPILSSRSDLTVAAHRTFAAQGQLFCTYEVFPSPGRRPHPLPHVAGSFRLEDADGHEIASAPATPIAVTADARFVRRVALSLEGLAPGRYRLVVEATDPAAGLDVEARQGFSIEARATP